MVEKKVAQALAKWAIENYVNQCQVEDIGEAFEAANIIVGMALNLADTLADPDALLVYKKFKKNDTH